MFDCIPGGFGYTGLPGVMFENKKIANYGTD